jgi:hypothetical protein
MPGAYRGAWGCCLFRMSEPVDIGYPWRRHTMATNVKVLTPFVALIWIGPGAMTVGSQESAML